MSKVRPEKASRKLTREEIRRAEIAELFGEFECADLEEIATEPVALKRARDRDREKLRPGRQRERLAGYARDSTGFLRPTAIQNRVRGKSLGELESGELRELAQVDPARLNALVVDAVRGAPEPDAAERLMAERLVKLATRVLNGGDATTRKDLERVRKAYAATYGNVNHEWARAYACSLLLLKWHPKTVHHAGIELDPLDLIEQLTGIEVVFMGCEPRVPWYLEEVTVRRWLFEHLTPERSGGRGKYTGQGIVQLLLRPADLANAILATKPSAALRETARTVLGGAGSWATDPRCSPEANQDAPKRR